MEDVLSSCCVLYNIPLYVAKRITPLLRPEDIKIACTKLVQAQIPKGIDLSSPGGRIYRAGLLKISHALSVLSAHAELRIHEQKIKRIKEIDPKKTLPLSATSRIMPRNEIVTTISTPEREKYGIYYEGNIVPTKLRFGSYLYYSGVISYQALEDALEWQKRKRPLIGQIAMEKGIVLPNGFAEALFKLQTAESFGQVARDLNIMTEANVVEITTEQKKYNCQIGQYFIEKSILELSEVERYIELFIEHNNRFAE
jgi:hypothetical protein